MNGSRYLLVLSICLLLASGLGAKAAPSRDPMVVVPMLKAWYEHGSFARLEQILGKPDGDAISGFSVTNFKLTDGSTVYVKATPNHNRIFTIDRRFSNSLTEPLYDPLDSYLQHPLPSSAPF